MTLAEYLSQKRGTAASLARALGVSHSTVLRWANGEHDPSLAMCARIASVTNDAVRAQDFISEEASR